MQNNFGYDRMFLLLWVHVFTTCKQAFIISQKAGDIGYECETFLNDDRTCIDPSVCGNINFADKKYQSLLKIQLSILKLLTFLGFLCYTR